MVRQPLGRFETKFPIIAMRHLRIDSMLAGNKKEIPVTERSISPDRLHAHYGNSNVAKHFTMCSLISSLLKTDADIRICFSTKSPVAGWDRVASFYRAEIQGAKLLLSRQVLSAQLQPSKDPPIVIRRDHGIACRIRRVGNSRTRRVCLAAFRGQLPARLRAHKEQRAMFEGAGTAYNRAGKEEDDFGYYILIVRVRLEDWPGSWSRRRARWNQRKRDL